MVSVCKGGQIHAPELMRYNKYALYSAFTNYATYADDRNGFGLRSTGNDTANVTMWNRENEVSKWISSPQFLQLAA